MSQTNQRVSSQKFAITIIAGIASVLLIIFFIFLFHDDIDQTDIDFADPEQPATDYLYHEYMDDHAILTPSELNQIELFLKLSPAERDEQPAIGETNLPQLTDLPFKLVVTETNDDPWNASATFQNIQTGATEKVHVGEELYPGVPLIYVTTDQAFVRNGPWIEYFR